jgi:hypothetical protein
LPRRRRGRPSHRDDDIDLETEEVFDESGQAIEAAAIRESVLESTF